MIKKYKFKLSWQGLLAVALVMFPNVFYLFLSVEQDPLAANSAAFWLWDVLENVGRFGVMISLIVLCRKADVTTKMTGVCVIAIVALILYYVLWILYFTGNAGGMILTGLAVFPVVFFFCTALLRRNAPAQIFALLFGITHIAVTASNYL